MYVALGFYGRKSWTAMVMETTTMITQAYNDFIVWSILCIVYQFPLAEFENHTQIYSSRTVFLNKVKFFAFTNVTHVNQKWELLHCVLSDLNNVCMYSFSTIVTYIFHFTY
jgi:hypothetical protein